MAWTQRTVTLRGRKRGFHLVTGEIEESVPELRDYRVGTAHLFLQHTSASLALNENADPDVRGDLERWFSHTVREDEPFYRHTLEGSDDMPAHIRSVLIGQSVTVPVTDGRLALGTWQGVYLCEHRNRGGSRQVVVTLTGENDR